MQLLTQKSLCPFCFKPLSPRDILFRCITPSCAGRTLVPEVGLTGGFPKKALCNECNRESTKRTCKHCNFELPSDIGTITQQIIAIIGGRDTGKSHYIATLIHKFHHEVGENFTASLRPLGDRVRKRWQDDFDTPLFVRKEILRSTQTATTDSSVKTPLLFRLTMTANHQYRHVLNLSFLDSAGEDMTSSDQMDLQIRYIGVAQAIIFLLDPLQIPAVRQLLRLTPDKLPKEDPTANPDFIVDRVIELFAGVGKSSKSKKIQTPIAFAVTKIDALRPLLPTSSALLRNSEHFGYLDMHDVEDVHTELAEHLKKWISPYFCQKIDDHFATYKYFGVSSLGAAPDGRTVKTINPIRVEDPFLWLLHRFGVVKIKKGK